MTDPEGPEGLDFPGTRRFEVVRQLGAGAFGVVYEVVDRERGARVALKTLGRADPGAIYRFKQEFRGLADVHHRNLVQLHELHSAGDLWFFTMELVAGEAFLDWVRPRTIIAGEDTWRDDIGAPAGPADAATDLGPLDEQRLRAALRQLAEGVSAIHAAGRLHRDLKPSNVLVARDGRVVILDFGLATDLAATGPLASVDQRICGTAAYMAPEQAAAQPLSEASDWYAVGAMLYEALSGRVPFLGSFVQVLTNKQRLDPPPPRSFAPDIPRDLDALCVELIGRDPARRPAGAAILRRLGASAEEVRGPISSGSMAAVQAPLVGRSPHLAQLANAFATARRGRGVTVFIHGPAGAGKSALARTFVDELARLDSAVVLVGRCYERESVPYKALDTLVDALSRHLRKLPRLEAEAVLPRDVHALARLFPVLRRVDAVASSPRRGLEVPDPQEVRRRAFAALRDLLARLADRRPLVLLIDDLQWGDADSAVVLLDLLRPPDPPSLLLIACYRSEDATESACVRLLRRPTAFVAAESEVRDLPVGPLAEEEARVLAAALLGGDRGPEVAAIARESGGDPFFVEELVRHVLGDPARGAAGGVPVTFEEALRARISGLAPEGRRLLEVVAVAGRPIEQAAALAAAGIEAAGEGAAIGVLRAARLVRTRGSREGDQVETYHNRVREAVVASLAPADLAGAHGRLAAALEASGRTDPEALELHFQVAGDLKRAARYAALAADRAAEALAFERAVDLYRLALDLDPSPGPGEAGLSSRRARLGDALANAGRGVEAARAYLEAKTGAREGADALELERRAAEQFLRNGHIEEGLAAIRGVLGAIGLELAPTPRRALLAFLLRRAWLRLRGLGFREREAAGVPPADLVRIDTCWSVAVGLGLVDNVRAADFQTRHLLLALRAGEPYRVARALAIEASYSAIDGLRARARTARIVEAARALAERVGNPHALGLADLMTGIAAVLEGRWSEACAWCEGAEARLREGCTGVDWEVSSAQLMGGIALCYRGELGEVTRRAHVILREQEGSSDRYAAANLRAGLLHMAWLAADRPAEAARDLDAVMSCWSREDYRVQHYFDMYMRTHLDLYAGDGAAARRRVEADWPHVRRALLLRNQHVRIVMRHLRARAALAEVAAGAADRAARVREAGADARAIEAEGTPWGGALATLLRAGLAVLAGDAPGASALLERAEAAFTAAGMGLYAAAARRRRGELLGGDAGRGLVAAADEWMTARAIRRPDRMTGLFAPGFAAAAAPGRPESRPAVTPLRG